MTTTFKKLLIFNTFIRMREWRNGRRAGLRIRCRKAWGFKSPLSQIPYLSPSILREKPAQLSPQRTFFSHADSNQIYPQSQMDDQFPTSTDYLPMPRV
jgi:hypothetical protein